MYRKKIFVHFSDCDPQGIVYFARYFEWAHEAIEEWLGENWDLWFRNKEVAVPLVKAESEFQGPAGAGRPLAAHLTIEKVGKTSVTFKTAFFADGKRDTTQSQPCAWVRTVHVFVDQKAFKPVAIPDTFRNLLS